MGLRESSDSPEDNVAEEDVVETTRPANKRTQKLTAETELRQKVFLVNRLLLLVSWRAFSYGRQWSVC